MFYTNLCSCDFQCPDSAIEWQLTTWIGCFLLVELMYSSLLKENVHSSNSQINAVYASNNNERTGKEMTTALTRWTSISHIRGEICALTFHMKTHILKFSNQKCWPEIVSIRCEVENIFRRQHTTCTLYFRSKLPSVV